MDNLIRIGLTDEGDISVIIKMEVVKSLCKRLFLCTEPIKATNYIKGER